MSTENLRNFYRFLEQHPEKRTQVGKLPDRASFIQEMVRLGSENGFAFSANELESALARLDSPMDESQLSDEELTTVAGGTRRVGSVACPKTRCLEESYILDPFCT